MSKDTQGAGVKVPPPLIFIFFMLVAFAIEAVFSSPISLPSFSRYIGLGLILLGLGLILYLSKQFKKAKTSIEPWKPTSTIITRGVYAYSRNPIYLAFCFISIGLGLLLSNIWLLISVIPAAICVYYVAILPEERYLTAKFGDEYLYYQQQVRRWL